ncbi:MAG: PAS domain-containing protein [Rhodospirillaceae bacterium]|nr:PAS domain-containing protein [Rhodospirillaceae bacterium]MBT4590172.1 PAS domain-containing protein [Rhodospirillaceae bacterium]MBT5942026.1 PAS domain-containing protein [Rhodospirillaceae bacterium]MBT7269172.1 PAS domain-containing protein [Rhodospirillaceae bacterium]
MAYFVQGTNFGFEQVTISAIIAPILVGSIAFSTITFFVLKNRNLLVTRLEAERQVSADLERMVEVRTAELQEQIKARKISEQKFRDFALSVADRFWETDENHNMISCTPPVGRLGLPMDDYLGKPLWEIPFGDTESVRWAEFKELLESKKSFRDFQLKRVFPGEPDLYVRFSGMALKDEDGNFTGFRCSVRDVSEEEEAKRQVDYVRERFFGAMEHLADAYILWDADEHFVSCNASYREIHSGVVDLFKPETTFEEYAKALSKSVWSHNLDDSNSAEEWAAKRLAEHRGSGSSRVTFHAGVWSLVSKERLQDGSVISFHSDITELKEALLEAEFANRTKTEFLANMSHELRTPLNAIIGFSETLNQGVFGPLSNIKQQEYVKDIHESGIHLLDLINEILDVSAIEAGKLELNEAQVDLKKIILAAIRLIKARAEEDGLVLQFQVDGQAPVVDGDERRLKQIFVNLLSNAVKFTEKEGAVSVEVQRNDDGSIAISVADNGIGMSPEDIEKAMEKFGQIRRNKGVEIEGTGLGLPLVRGLVEAHGGKLSIESALDKGTTVTVVIPRERVTQ